MRWIVSVCRSRTRSVPAPQPTPSASLEFKTAYSASQYPSLSGTFGSGGFGGTGGGFGAPVPGDRDIDLVVNDVPFREAMAEIAKASDFEIVVHPAVPASIRVTAKMYQVPASQLINSLVEQGHLRLQREDTASSGVSTSETKSAQPHVRYAITPQSESVGHRRGGLTTEALRTQTTAYQSVSPLLPAKKRVPRRTETLS